ncbi:MAG: fumarylacetoacetate hydrolase family protein [Ilumatobacteraceae bacterium]
MRIARFSSNGSTRLGVVDGDRVLDLGAVDPALPSDVGELLEHGGVARVRSLDLTGAPRLDLAEVELLAPVRRPPTFLAVGLNYADHIAETGQDRPTFPKIFNKQISCVNDPFGSIVVPEIAPDQVDYEGELGIVIGAPCRAVGAADALEYVAGYVIVNDVSVRDWQRASPTMTMGKSFDTHGPIGPWMVTADEVPDPQSLRIRTWVDEDLRQDDTTALMLHSCAELIEFLSRAFTLLPGTVIATGTPAGVGAAMDPPGFVHAGQTVTIEIEGIGRISNPVIAG